MIIRREPQEVREWFLVFEPDCLTWWTRLIPGRFKHVSAFGWAEQAKCWIFYDVSLAQTKVVLLPEGKAATDYLAAWTQGCSILRIDARPAAKVRPRLIFSCVSAIRHLVGLPGGAVRPDGLWDDCLREGAEIVWNELRKVERGKAGDAAIAAAPVAGAPASAEAGR